MGNEKAETKPITLYPTQRTIVEAFAKKNGRSFSNAVQFIIEDWQRLVDPDGSLLKAHKAVSRQAALTDIQGVRKGA